MERLQASVEPGRVWRRRDDVRPLTEHLASGHRLVQQVSKALVIIIFCG